MNEYVRADHCVYLVQYHIVWCPKFRFPVLHGRVEEALKTILYSVCQNYGFRIKALEVMPDHIHIFVSAPQTIAPGRVAQILKSCSAKQLFAMFPGLKQFYARCGSMWSRGYFLSTIGCISEDTVKRYIAMQKQRG